MQKDYDKIIHERAQHVFDVMATRVYAKNARINGRLEPMTAKLRRGDVIEIFTDEKSHPEEDWETFAHSFKARKAIRRYRMTIPEATYHSCPECNPIPGEEVIGISDPFGGGWTTIHKRDCRVAISMASSYGDNVESVDFKPDETLYPVTLSVRAVDRNHLFVDLVDCITNTFKLSMESFNTKTNRNIVVCMIRFGVHSYNELRTIINHISSIDGVDEVKRLSDDDMDIYTF